MLWLGERPKKKERCNIKSVPLSLLEQDWDIWTALTPTSKKNHLRFQTEVGGCELLLSWWCGGLRSWCPTSQNFRLSVLGRSGGGGYTCSQCTIIVPPHLSFLMLRRVVSRLFFFLALLPLSQVLWSAYGETGPLNIGSFDRSRLL